MPGIPLGRFQHYSSIAPNTHVISFVHLLDVFLCCSKQVLGIDLISVTNINLHGDRGRESVRDGERWW